MTVDTALSTFIDDWNAGRRPDLDAHLQTVAAGDRPELARLVSTFLDHAPTPAYDAAALAQLEADPALVAAREQLLGQPLASLVSERREARKLSVSDLAQRLGKALGMTGRDERIAGYLERLEHDELDGRRLTERLLEGLAGALKVSREQLESASLRGAAPAGALFRMDAGADAGAVLTELEAVADALYSASPAAGDEVDELFLGGR